MTTKEWLNRARNIDREIDSLVKSRDMAYARCFSITQSYSGMAVSGTKDPHEKFDRLAEYEIIIDQKVDELTAVKMEIEQAIERVEDVTYRILLRSRYINGSTWEQIAVCMGISYQWVCHIHGEALKLFSTVDRS